MEVKFLQRTMTYILLVISILTITGSCLAFSSTRNSENIEFLNSYGWEVEENPLEKVSVTIPETFDDVYNNYNILQKEAGLDLSEYRGKSAIRYTYSVLNYPKEVENEVRANIIVVDNRPIAGDIMTTSISGFMHSLCYPQ